MLSLRRTRAGVAKLDGRGLQIGGAEHDLLRLLDDAGLPRPVQVGPVVVGYASHFGLGIL